ncbi:unnamed protein product [Cylindrotheca closterium]|uniref:Agmatine deiminase n=1 Tax=Cylindrotheca closterium TaxID=2856 RepID=A0AAD2G7L3_9STRA|nr:unnamed protein product [Cylindrotheca closterium]
MKIMITCTCTRLLTSLFCIATVVNASGLPTIPDPDNIYTYPAEDTIEHEATWLQWPHNYGWDPIHQERYEDIWLEMALALHTGEKVHIVAYDENHRAGIETLLVAEGADMTQIRFFVYKTDDVWVRDNGPVYVFDQYGNRIIEDWIFNGWGDKQDYFNDDVIPECVADEKAHPYQAVPMVNEAGSIEVDGRGTLMAKRSSIINENRNPGMSQADAEAYFKRYLGVTNFIWVDGTKGLDITDDHIDGDARFANDDTIVLHGRDAFFEPSEYDIITNATDANGAPYKIVELPKTSVELEALNFTRGVYMNYYVGNDVVVFPIFEDPNDDIAAAILQDLYPNREIKKIVFTELYKDGGIAHCVTMQQPVANNNDSIPSDKTLAPYSSKDDASSSGGTTGATFINILATLALLHLWWWH